MSLIDTLAALREKSVAWIHDEDVDGIFDPGSHIGRAQELLEGYVTVTDAFFEQAISEALGDLDVVDGGLEEASLSLPAMISEDGEVEL